MARGRGRGPQAGRGRGRGQQNPFADEPAAGVIRQPEKQKKGKAKAQGKRATKASSVQLAQQVDAVPEDALLRHQEIKRAHTDAVVAIVMQEDAIYTASRDKLLKRWKVQRLACGRYELTADLEVPLGDVCWCLVSAGEWLFCGLGDGRIRGFSKSGQDMTLSDPSSSKRVSCLLQHQHVLISAGADATVRCWTMPAGASTFSCTASLSEGILGAVQCMCVLSECLWVGGTSGVSIVELASLRVAKQLQPRKFVSGFLLYEGHMVVSYADGTVCIFDPAGNQKLCQPPMPAGPVLCMAGLDSGPRVLCGHSKGQVSSITLPMFQLKHYWQALERCKVQSLCCAGHDGIFLLGAENGSLQLWQRSAPAGL